MQIQNVTNTNFKGGFRFPNMKTTARNELPLVYKKGKQIFYDFENKGDVFLLTRPEKDYTVAKFIKKHRLKFEYYPEISTKTRLLDCEEHEPLTEMLNELKPQKITDFKTMMNTIKEGLKTENIAKSTLTSSLTTDISKADEQIFSALDINIKDAIHELKDGLHVVKSKTTRENAFITPFSKNGFKYVLYMPKSIEEPVKRYAVTSDGLIIAEFNTPNEILQFKRNVAATLEK